MRTYGVNGFKSYIRNHIKLGYHFSSLIASRADLFRIVTPPAYALTVISIVPRTPAMLRKFLAVKAREMKLHNDVRNDRTSHINGESKRNGGISTNGECNTNGSSFVNGEAKTNGGTTINGSIHVNGETRTKKESYINGVHKTNGEPKTNGESKINGVCKVNGFSNVNGHASIDEEPHINGELTLNGLPPMIGAPSTPNDDITSCVEEWFTEYANMVTKAAYDLVNRQGEIMLTSTVIGGMYVIRINSANPKTEEKYLRRAFEILVAAAEEVLDEA